MRANNVDCLKCLYHTLNIFNRIHSRQAAPRDWGSTAQTLEYKYGDYNANGQRYVLFNILFLS